MSTETRSVTFSGLSLEKLTNNLLAIGSNRLPSIGKEKRPPIMPNPDMQNKLLEIFRQLLPENQVAQAFANFIEDSYRQPAALVYPDAFSETSAENEEYVAKAILSAANKASRRRGQPKQYTSLPLTPLLETMAKSLGQIRNDYAANRTSPQSNGEKLAEFINQVSDNKPLSETQQEFIVITKLAGIFNPETPDLQQFIKNQQASPNSPVKIDACPSFGAGSLGQLMPQPSLVVKQSDFGDKGRYQPEKKTRFIKFIQTALQQAKQLGKYGLDCNIVTAEWEMPIRPLLYQQIASLSIDQQKLFGVEPADLDLILNEYDQAYKETSILEVSREYFADVCRRFPAEAQAGKIISSLALLESAGFQPEKFFSEFTAYLVNGWLLPNLSQTGGIDRLLEQINMPFTQYFFNIWSELYGIGKGYSKEQKQALARSLRLDYIFYRPQYVFENWLAAQTGFIGVFGNAVEEKKFYQPLGDFAYPKSLPFLPVPDQALLEKI